MDCKEFEKKIPQFLRDELSNKELKEFIEHVDSCSDCHEELSIQYLVYAAMPRLEAGETFNLNRELTNSVENATHKLHLRNRLMLTAYGMEMLTVVAVGGALVLAYLLL